MMRKLIILALLIALCGTVSACGRKNRPLAPDGADPKYPRTYPAPTPVPGSSS